MPELARFNGIKVSIYYDDIGEHNLPHIHVEYGKSKACYSLEGKRLAGSLPAKQSKMTKEWIGKHKDDLIAAWEKAYKHDPIDKIEE